ncbi:MAG: hypothetical protein GYA51_05275 [Candidatus Methanofastidiosa archaeon]|jgi:hypothetical protein|nr:hypothetical protein [Candidatus Methanofastidiosa archaeon]
MVINKKGIIERIFDYCEKNNNYVFDNELIKKIVMESGSKTNPYDMTKIDNISKLPKTLLDKDYFIAHIGSGKHMFVKDISKIYHNFEPIKETEVEKWAYVPSILNDYSISESSVLSLCFNQRIMHDFLYKDVSCSPKMYNSERKRGINFSYNIDNIPMKFENLQTEIDLTIEMNGKVTVFEGKNTKNSNEWIDNFNIYQLYTPFRYYHELKEKNKLDISEITACYLIRQRKETGSYVRLYNYTFKDPIDLTSIKVIKKREYRVLRELDEN